DEGTARMVNADKRAVGDDIERLRAAIIRMGTPADVGEQAGGAAIACFLHRLLDAERLKSLAGPRLQLAAMRNGARTQDGEFLGCRDERILALLLLVEQRIEVTLAHAER